MLFFFYVNTLFWVCVIGEKDAIILDVQPDEPTESPGLKSKYSVGWSAYVSLPARRCYLDYCVALLHFFCPYS